MHSASNILMFFLWMQQLAKVIQKSLSHRHSSQLYQPPHPKSNLESLFWGILIACGTFYLYLHHQPILNLKRPFPFELGLSSGSYYVCKQSLCLKYDVVSIVSSVIKLSQFEQQVLLILKWNLTALSTTSFSQSFNVLHVMKHIRIEEKNLSTRKIRLLQIKFTPVLTSFSSIYLRMFTARRLYSQTSILTRGVIHKTSYAKFLRFSFNFQP